MLQIHSQPRKPFRTECFSELLKFRAAEYHSTFTFFDKRRILYIQETLEV